jgi:hypothetical protein
MLRASASSPTVRKTVAFEQLERRAERTSAESGTLTSCRYVIRIGHAAAAKPRARALHMRPRHAQAWPSSMLRARACPRGESGAQCHLCKTMILLLTLLFCVRLSRACVCPSCLCLRCCCCC